MRHTFAILVLALVALVARSAAAPWNCTAIAAPSHNFYNPPTACANDTAIKACLDTYATCSAAATACSGGMTCVAARMRCIEAAAPTASGCSTWSAMFSNEKLYLAAGGDYNGSTLELSCKNAVCGFMNARPTVTCVEADYAKTCFDAVTSTPAPQSTIPPVGATVVSFKISGDKAKFDVLLATEAGRKQAHGIVLTILVTVLKTSAGKIVIVKIGTGSLVIDFYTTDASLDVATVSSRLADAKANPPAGLFNELATASGIPASQLGVSEFTVTVSTPAPAGGTPAPLTTGASAVATLMAVAAALLALLL